MKVAVLVVGKPRHPFVKKGVAHYLKHLTGLATVKVVPLKPQPMTKSTPDEKVIKAEGDRILERIKGPGKVVALDVTGQAVGSPQLAGRFGKWETSGANRLSFVIGGPLGLDKRVLARADEVLSLSALTMSHELCLLMALEQIYRALATRAGRPYAR